MTGRRSLRTPRCLRTVALAVGVAAGALAPGVGGAAPAGTPARPAARAPRAADEPGLQVLEQSTTVAANGDFVLLFDVADDVGAGSDFAVDLYPRIEDRRDLADAAAGRPRNALVTFNAVPIGPPVAGAPRSTGVVLNLARPAGPVSYPLDEPGVYPLRIRLRRADPRPDETLYTYLIRDPQPADRPTPMPVGVLAEVHQPTPARGEPTLDPDLAERATAVFDALAGVPDLPASVAVTPETAQAAGTDGPVHDAIARALDGEHRELLGGPYVSIDPTVLVANGLVDELARQAALGADVLTRTFEAPAVDTWVLPGRLDRRTVAALDRVGVRNLVLPGDALSTPATVQPLSVPGADGSRAVVVAAGDEVGATEAADPVLAAHQLVGRLAALATVDPRAGAVVRIDATGPQPAAAVAVLGLLGDPPAVLEPTTVTARFAAGDPAPAVAPLAAPVATGLGRYPTLARETHAVVASYASMLDDGSPGLHEFDEDLARAASRDLTPAQRNDRLRAVATQVERRLGAISVPARDRVTLGARNATFPLPIRSDLRESVHVVVELSASDRLGFPRDRLEVVLDGERTVVQVPVRVRAAGDTPMVIRVRTPDGRLLAESRYSIRSTAVSGVGLVLTLGAALFLALWWGRHWRRARRPRHRAV